MHDNTPAYGLWSLVVLNSAVFIMFAFSFFRPRSSRDWRTLGAFAAFIVALFTEMYGFPLTIYLLSGWLGSRFPGLDLFSHDAGHLLNDFIGWKGNPHLSPPHVASNFMIFGGFTLLAASWQVLYEAQRSRTLATTGPYASVRHPQYVAFFLIMLGFLLQWPTLLTLLMFPILVVTYVRLAQREEREVRAELGGDYERYAATTPSFFPHLDYQALRRGTHAGEASARQPVTPGMTRRDEPVVGKHGGER